MLLIILNGSTLPTNASNSHKLLQGLISIDVIDQQAQFETSLLNSPNIPCNVKPALYRLIEVCENAQVRKIVWQHMLKEELTFINKKTIREIELIAQTIDLDLK